MEQSPRICLTSLALLWFVRIICIVACSCNVFIFIALQYFIVSVYFFFFFLSFLLLVNICWALFSFRLFKLVLLQTLVHVFRRTYICVLQIICLGVELLGFRLCIYSIRVDTSKQFSKVMCQFTLPPTGMRVLGILYPSQLLLFFCLFYFYYSGVEYWYFLMILIFISLMISEIECILYVYWLFVYSVFEVLIEVICFSIAFFVSSVFNGDLIVNPMDIPKYTFLLLDIQVCGFPTFLSPLPSL